MVWAKKILISVLSVVFVATLIATALATSANSALSHASNIETWLNQSGLYQKFISTATDQAIKTVGSSEPSGSVTLSQSAVQQAAYVAFTNKDFQEKTKTFVNSNYAWLEGKTDKPNFTINLTTEKQSFSKQISQFVQAHLNSLPVCTAPQLAELSSITNIDPLNITCRPSTIDPATEANLVNQAIYKSTGFLSDPIITASDLNSKGNESGGEAYYKHFASAPRYYKAAVKLPLIYAVTALVSGLGIIFLAFDGRFGLRIVSAGLLFSALVVLAIRIISDSLVNKIETQLFNQANKGQLQQSLTQFFSRIEAHVNKTELYFVIGYAILAILALIVFLLMRERNLKRPNISRPKPVTNRGKGSIAAKLNNKPRKAPKLAPIPPGPPPQQKPAKKPPRLIQG